MPDQDFYHSDYLRKLLIESPYIKARLENAGGSVILTGVAADTESLSEYSSQIGSSFHLDLIEAEMIFKELPQDQQTALIQWAAGLTPKQAALYYNAKGTVQRKRRERGIAAITEKMNEGSTDDDNRGTGQRPPEQGRPKPPRFAPQTRDYR